MLRPRPRVEGRHLPVHSAVVAPRPAAGAPPRAGQGQCASMATEHRKAAKAMSSTASAAKRRNMG